MFRKSHCSPRKNKTNVSCYNIDFLIKIASILNESPECEKIDINLTKKRLYDRISDEIKKISHCKDELCWLDEFDRIKTRFPDNEMKKIQFFFKPMMPKSWLINKNEWLTTTDINNVLYQYQNKYDDFIFMGARPIDFDLEKDGICLTGGNICNIDIKKLINQSKTKIGMVFNTDPSTGEGQHWFSVYVDLTGMNRKGHPSIYYFDSAKKINEKNMKKKIPKEIQNLVIDLQNQNRELNKSKVNKSNKKLEFIWNDKKHQFKNTECGVYCLHFLTEMLKGKSFRKYVNATLNDKKMERFRKEFFIERK